MANLKLAIVCSHPIQHFCPQYASWSKDASWQVKVFFGSRAGSEGYFDPNFGTMIAWPNLHLDRFDHSFLTNDTTCSDGSLVDDSLERELAGFDPDAVLVYGYAQKLQRTAWAWATRRNKTIVYFSDSEVHSRRSPIKNVIKSFYLPRYFRSIDYYLVTGNANESYYRRYGADPARFIRSSYPIDYEFYSEAVRRRDDLRHSLRAEFDIPDDSMVVTMVGKLIAKKNQIELVHALRHVSQARVTAILIGSGADEANLKSHANRLEPHRVIFAGFRSPDDLPRFYSATDIYLHTSWYEPHSVAISEAIFMGCPVVLSRYCGSYGMDDDVQIGLNGLTYRTGDDRHLAARIEYLATHREVRERYADHSRKTGLRNQTVSHFRTLEILRGLMAAHA